MNKLNDERQATKPKEKERKKETIHEFIDWLNEKWETTAVPVILVPYKTTMYMARFSHNQQKIWKAMRILVAHRAHQTLDSVSFTCRQRVQHFNLFHHLKMFRFGWCLCRHLFLSLLQAQVQKWSWRLSDCSCSHWMWWRMR